MDWEVRSAMETRATIEAMARRIDESMIETPVRGFYTRVRKDPLIGPIFGSRIGNWEPHLENMLAFWSSLTLQRGRCQGQPMAKHLPLPVDARHFAVRKNGA
jgi:hemoglobin